MQAIPRRILIIDDDGDVAELLSDYLGGDDACTVEMASTAEAGLAAAARARPDLVLLDINLPGMDGLEGLEQLRRTAGRVPVIMISGSADVAAPSDAVNRGALALLPKPFDFRQLDELVALVLDRALSPAAHGPSPDGTGEPGT